VLSLMDWPAPPSVLFVGMMGHSVPIYQRTLIFMAFIIAVEIYVFVNESLLCVSAMMV